jgi:hypothetical protein
MPSDGSGAAVNTGLAKARSPDGTRILMRTDNTRQVFSIDPVKGN